MYCNNIVLYKHYIYSMIFSKAFSGSRFQILREGVMQCVVSSLSYPSVPHEALYGEALLRSDSCSADA